MEQDPKAPSSRLLRAVTDLDAAAIDALYGLEPAFEPDGSIVGGAATAWVTVACPYCGEAFETLADLSAGPATYVEDCQVCCQPIEMSCELDEEGRLAAFRVQRID